MLKTEVIMFKQQINPQGVTANTPAGVITTHNTSMGASGTANFTVTNNKVHANDVVVVSVGTSGIATGGYSVNVNEVTNGAFNISLRNELASAASENVDINYVVIGGSRS
jgi:hypothetical protein